MINIYIVLSCILGNRYKTIGQICEHAFLTIYLSFFRTIAYLCVQFNIHALGRNLT